MYALIALVIFGFLAGPPCPQATPRSGPEGKQAQPEDPPAILSLVAIVSEAIRQNLANFSVFDRHPSVIATGIERGRWRQLRWERRDVAGKVTGWIEARETQARVMFQPLGIHFYMKDVSFSLEGGIEGWLAEQVFSIPLLSGRQ